MRLKIFGTSLLGISPLWADVVATPVFAERGQLPEPLPVEALPIAATDVSAVRRGGAVHRTTAVRGGPRGRTAVRSTTVVRGPRGAAVRRTTVVGRPGRHGTGVRWARPAHYWWRPGAAIAAGAALGFVTASAAVALAGAAPGPNMCWYYTNQSRTQGFWDTCPL